MADTEQTASTPLYALLPPALKQILLLVGLAAAVAAGVALVLWSQAGNYTPLYSGLSERDIGEITAQLDGSGVKYKLDPANGGLLVASDRKYEVRMQLASSGLPRGTGFGVDEMPNRSTFGQTPFMENALYVRAVETELARTIGAMQPVENARVHLALPPQSVFLRQKREPSASVLLKLYSGRRLDEGQVQAVVHLVASSVPELLPSRVTVVDQAGTLLTGAANDDTASLTSSQFDYRKQLEQEYSRRIEGLLGSIVGAERVRASVSAELDFTVTEQTRESFDPAVQVVRSEQTSEDSHRGQGVEGVPGALSNQPPEITPQPRAATGAARPAAAGTGRAAPAGAAAATTTEAEPQSVSRSSTRNFELDKTVSHTRQAVGLIKRLSIGVLVDNRPPANGRGAGTPLAEQELASLTELVKKSVGFDEMRGDTISVLNSAFQPAAAVQNPPAPSFWERPQFWSIARQALGALLVLVLAWFVLRPMMQMLTRPQPISAMPVAVEYSAQMYPAMAGGRPMGLPVSYDDRMAAARSVAGQDPRQVAQVVRNWVGEENG
jgi:flagellar M-ring protein FliF